MYVYILWQKRKFQEREKLFDGNVHLTGQVVIRKCKGLSKAKYVIQLKEFCISSTDWSKLFMYISSSTLKWINNVLFSFF